MRIKKEAAENVVKVLLERAPKMTCPLCGKQDWTVPNGFIFLPVQENFPKLSVGGKGVPVVPLTCSTCGNTHLINLLQLGLDDLLDADE